MHNAGGEGDSDEEDEDFVGGNVSSSEDISDGSDNASDEDDEDGSSDAEMVEEEGVRGGNMRWGMGEEGGTKRSRNRVLADCDGHCGILQLKYPSLNPSPSYRPQALQ